MSRLLLQIYLDAHQGIPADLAASFLVKARRHGKHDNLVLFKYGIAADFAHPMVRECRGIILDEVQGWAVVSRAFDKFGNHGESYVETIDWSTARVQEKLDGSLCVLYHYDGTWHVATSGSPDASGEVQQAGMREGLVARSAKTFADYFWEVFKAEGGTLPDPSDFCFAFELMGPLNRIVVVHEKPWLRLLSVRNRVTGEQFLPELFAAAIGIPPVRSFSLGTIEDIQASFAHISPVSQEGYVIVDAAFRRVKIKHPGYVALHHAKDGMGPKAFVEMARTGETSEVALAFPEFRPLVEEAKNRYTAFVASVRASYEPIKAIASQKDFAAQALLSPCSAALFQLRKGVVLEDFLRGVPIEKLMAWMGVDAISAEETEVRLELADGG